MKDRLPSSCARVTTSRSGMSLVELLVVMAIMTIILVLTTVSYRSLSDSVEVTGGAQQVVDSLNLARQVATSKNEYVQIRFYAPADGTDARKGHYTAVGVFRSDAPLYGSAADYQKWEADGAFRRVAPLAKLAGSCAILKNDTFSPLLKSLADQSRSGTTKLPDGTTCNWVGFYFKPDGSTDITTTNSPSFSVCSLKVFLTDPSKLPASYAVLALDPVIGRYQFIRP